MSSAMQNCARRRKASQKRKAAPFPCPCPHQIRVANCNPAGDRRLPPMKRALGLPSCCGPLSFGTRP